MENRDDQNKNQTGQQGQQSTDSQNKQDLGQEGQSSSGQTGSSQGAFDEKGGDTGLAQGQKSQFDKQSDDETGADKGFVGTNKEDSSKAYLSEAETDKSDFAAQGQGATERNEDIESGTTPQRDAALDDGS
jgi:hypothetical protein